MGGHRDASFRVEHQNVIVGGGQACSTGIVTKLRDKRRVSPRREQDYLVPSAVFKSGVLGRCSILKIKPHNSASNTLFLKSKQSKHQMGALYH